MEKFFYPQKESMLDEEFTNILPSNKVENIKFGAQVTRIKAKSKLYGDKKGNYVTVNQVGKRLPIHALSDELVHLFETEQIKRNKVLVVGIGNPYMTTDSLGSKVVEYLMQKRKENLYLFTPFLEGITGISSFDIVKSLVKIIKPTLIIVVDALATSDGKRVCKSFQASTAGITPGSAVGKKIIFNKKTLGAKVVAIGVPTVINVKNLTDKFDFETNLVTPKNIDILLNSASTCIAKAILKVTE